MGGALSPLRKVSFLMPLQAEAAWRTCIHPRACLDPDVAFSLHVGGWLGLPLSCMPCLPCRPFGCGRRRLSFGCTSFAPSVRPQIVIMGGRPCRAPNKETCCWPGREGAKIMSAPLVRCSSCALPTGGTWCWPRVILDSGLDDRDAGILETPSGTLLATTFTSLAYQPILERARKEGRWIGLASGDGRRRMHASMPHLGKASWGRSCVRRMAGSTGRPRRLQSSIAPTAPSRSPMDGCSMPARSFGQVSDGSEWRFLGMMDAAGNGQPRSPAREGDDPAEYHELHAVEMPDRRVVVHIRNHNPSHAGETLQCESTDGAELDQATIGGCLGLPFSSAPPGRWPCPDDLWASKAPFGNQARLSEDGRSWSAPISLSTDGASGDLGYPSTAQLTDGSLVSVWHERLANHPKAVLRQARWSLEA